MLPRNFPKVGGFLVNAVPKFGGVELEIQGHEPRFGFQRNIFVFEYTLLSAEDASGQHIYHLKVQKQPGTLAIPITIRIHLPNHASLKSTPIGAIVQGKDLLIKMDLRTDIDLQIIFSLPYEVPHN